MDIKVSLSDFRSLSQSELIMRNLFATVQIGSSCVPSRGVLVQEASFRSGTVENPLVLTLKNSQTETIMYVRNIPISTVLQLGGLFEHWVAVYPPGDPQNLHFDASILPKEGVPQVCITVSIQEDLTCTALPAQRHSIGFSYTPQQRPSINDAGYGASRPDMLRHSVDSSMQAELERERGPSSSFLHSGRPSMMQRGSLGGVDSTVREKELQAQRIKEHVAEMANAQKRAQDTSRALQDNLRILEDMKRQLKGLEMQIAEQRVATQLLERDRDQLRAEEAQLQEQIRSRDIMFQELRESRDEIDRELTRVLSEGERQKNAMEASSRDFTRQTQTMMEDIDQSKRKVSQLAESLKIKEQRVTETEIQTREQGAALASREAAERDEMRAQLDQTRMAMAGARTLLEETQRRSQTAEMNHQEVKARLAGIEIEVQSLNGAVEGKGSEGSRYGNLAQDAKADFDAKREKLETQAKKVQRLEAELSGNREQLEKLSNRIAELHTEAHDKELAAKRFEDERAELQRRLELHQRSAAEASGLKGEREGQVERAERELAEARAALVALETAQSAPSATAGDEEVVQLEGAVQNKRDELSQTRNQVDTLQRKCVELEEQAGKRREVLQQKSTELETAQARVAELTKQLAEASNDIASTNSLLQQLEVDVLSRSAGLDEIRRLARERADAVAAARSETSRAGSVATERVAELDRTVASAKGELERLAGARRQADMQRMSLEGSLAENQLSLKELKERIDTARVARDKTAEELAALTSQHEAKLAELQAGTEELKQLRDVSSVGRSDLESTQGAIAFKISQIAQLESECREAVARLEAEASELSSQRDEKRSERSSIMAEVEAMQAERDAAANIVAASRRARAELDEELNRVLQARVGLLKDGQDALSQTEAHVQAAVARSQARATRNREMEDSVRGAETQRMTAHARLEAIREEIRTEEAKLDCTQGVLGEKQATLIALRAELEGQQAEAARLQDESAQLERQAREYEGRCRSEEAVSSELQTLLRRQRQLADDCAAEEQLHQEALERRSHELEETRSRLHRIGAEAMQRKDEEIRMQEEQIRTLEDERDNLLKQVATFERERNEMEERILERERVRAGVAASVQAKAQECGDIEMTIREAKSGSSQLEQQYAEWESIIDSIAKREEALRQEAEEMSEQIRKAHEEMAIGGQDIDREVADINLQVDKLRDTCAAESAEADRHQHSRDELQRELASVLEECRELDVAEASLRDCLEKTRSQLRETRVAQTQQQSLMEEQAGSLERLQAEREQQSKASDGTTEMRKRVQEFEDSLQELSNRLVEAQETVRRRRTEEQELRADIEKLKESIRSASDKMTFQMEHSNLQFESIQKLEEQKARLEDEVEVLTLGLHDAEQRNEYLQKENSLMQQQVEGLYEGSLQDWAAEVHRVKVAAEVARYKEDIDIWKQKAEQMRKEKQQELAGLQRQHEDTVRRLRERAAAVQAEIDQCEQAAKRREAAMAKQRESGEGPAATAEMPGLVVPQRPLPNGHMRRKALLIGINYTSSHAPLKGCVNDLWNMQCLLRHTLQYGEDQLRLLIDCVDGRAQKPERAPTKANVHNGLRWLVGGAQPGDNLLLVFCGYGAQHPRSPDNEKHEGYLVPVDFAADLPGNFFDATGGSGNGEGAGAGVGQGYRLVSMLEIAGYVSQLPPMCRMSVMMDCCYGMIPGLGPGAVAPPTFPKVKRGQVDYTKLRDFISRPRFLELPVLPVQHTPPEVNEHPVTKCWLHCFSGSRLEEWSAEFPIEGTVQGAFSWAFLKALARGHFHCGLYQFQRMLVEMLSDLKVHFRGVEQSPVLQLSQSASMQDVVLWT